MGQPPTTAIIPKVLVRNMPFMSHRPFQSPALAPGGTFVAEWDVGKRIADPNQFLAGAFPGAANPPVAIGPFLDAEAFSTQAGSITIEFAIDQGCLYRTLTPSIVPANAFTNISGLRITGRFVRITFTNTAGVASLTEFGAQVRST